MGDKHQEKTLQLLEKARLLREQASTLENTKREAEQLVQQQQQEVQREEQQKKDAWKDRYSVVVPILKDMGEEVMEKVDFPPRIMGGEIDVLVGEIKTY
jgi:lysyl-tRNA synthetase class I